MSWARNPGRVVGFWYLLLVLGGPLRLIYIPNKLFVHDNAAATAGNIAAHELLFRFGMLSDLLGAVVLIFLVLAFYRLFKGVDQQLAVLLVIVGGVMPALINFVNVVSDAGALMFARSGGAGGGGGADFLSVFDKPQRDALVLLFLRLHHAQIVAQGQMQPMLLQDAEREQACALRPGDGVVELGRGQFLPMDRELALLGR